MQPVSLRLPFPPAALSFDYEHQTKAVSFIYSNRERPVMETVLPAFSMLYAAPEQLTIGSFVTVLNDPGHTIEATDLINSFYAALPIGMRLFLQLKTRAMRDMKREEKGRIVSLHNADCPFKLVYHSKTEVVLGFNYKKITLWFSLLLHRPRHHSSQINLIYTTSITNYKGIFLGKQVLTRMFRKTAPALLKNLVASIEKPQL